MSLLSTNYEDFVRVSAVKQPDTEGGMTTVYTDGERFKACANEPTGGNTAIADTKNGNAIYKITTSRSNALVFHEIIKRVLDGKTFRIISNPDDDKTPKGAGLDIRIAKAEEWSVPT